jgi:acyl-CoA thioester hydrolase
LTSLLSDFPIVIELPVVWGEMDTYRHVNNIFYLKNKKEALPDDLIQKKLKNNFTTLKMGGLHVFR